MRALAISAVAWASGAFGQLNPIVGECLCGDGASWFAKVHADSEATATVVETVVHAQADGTLLDGPGPELGSTFSILGDGARAGDFLLVDAAGAFLPLADGDVVSCGGKRFGTDGYLADLGTGDCYVDLHGEPASCACSSAPSGWLFGAVVLVAATRRRNFSSSASIITDRPAALTTRHHSGKFGTHRFHALRRALRRWYKPPSF